jgi:hypothetical protein
MLGIIIIKDMNWIEFIHIESLCDEKENVSTLWVDPTFPYKPNKDHYTLFSLSLNYKKLEETHKPSLSLHPSTLPFQEAKFIPLSFS